MEIGYHTHVWHGQELPGVNIWSRWICLAFSAKYLAVYIFGKQIINWCAP